MCVCVYIYTYLEIKISLITFSRGCFLVSFIGDTSVVGNNKVALLHDWGTSLYIPKRKGKKNKWYYYVTKLQNF